MLHRSPPGNSEKTRSIIVRITRVRGKIVQGLEMDSERSFLLIAGSDQLFAGIDRLTLKLLIVGIPVLWKHGFLLTIYVLVLNLDFSTGVVEEPSNVLRDHNASMMASRTKYTDGSLMIAFPDTLGH